MSLWQITGGALAIAASAGAMYEAYARRCDEENYPPPGEKVPAGSLSLHMKVEGEGRAGVPTVVVETGIYDCCSSWQFVREASLPSRRLSPTIGRAMDGVLRPPPLVPLID